MAKRTTPPTANDDEVRALLDRYHCPVPFHAVRTRFLGNIASPDMQDSPVKMVEALWGGELPTFDSIDDANELIGALVMGLWNRLTRHQERSTPFRLTRMEVPATRDGMAKLARLRREELEGFVEGLFGDKESLDLPERAHKALGTLAEIRAMLEASQVLAEGPTKPGASDDIAVTIGHFRERTRIAEHEMHEAVLSCTRARTQMLTAPPVRRPMQHWPRADVRTARRPINARAETVATSPMFRDAFARRRALIPAQAFYEWQSSPMPSPGVTVRRWLLPVSGKVGAVPRARCCVALPSSSPPRTRPWRPSMTACR